MVTLKKRVQARKAKAPLPYQCIAVSGHNTATVTTNQQVDVQLNSSRAKGRTQTQLMYAGSRQNTDHMCPTVSHNSTRVTKTSMPLRYRPCQDTASQTKMAACATAGRVPATSCCISRIHPCASCTLQPEFAEPHWEHDKRRKGTALRTFGGVPP